MILLLLVLPYILCFIKRPQLFLKPASHFSATQKDELPRFVSSIYKGLGIFCYAPAKKPKALEWWYKKNSALLHEQYKKSVKIKYDNFKYCDFPLKRVKDTSLSKQTVWKNPSYGDVCELIKQGVDVLQITGHGGSGKSSFAAQIGLWALASSDNKTAVYFDKDLEKGQSFKEFLVNYVREATADPKLYDEFIMALFEHGYLFVIADGVSELSAETREVIANEVKQLSFLVVTTRKPMTIMAAKNTQYLQTLPLENDQVTNYLRFLIINDHSLKNTDNVLDLDLAIELRKIFQRHVSGGKPILNITPLLVKLFYFNYKKLGKKAINLTKIHRNYIKELCREKVKNNKAQKIDQTELTDAVFIIAKSVLADNFIPKLVKITEIRDLLKQKDLKIKSFDYIQCLLTVSILKQKDQAGVETISFKDDPIAEFWGALAYAHECGNNKESWQALIKKVNQQQDDASGFLTALHVIYQENKESEKWPANLNFDYK